MTEGIDPPGIDEKARNERRVPPEYRQALVAAEQKCQDDYDKTVLSLSGGALGVSFVFVKDIVGDGAIQLPWVILAAWLCWAASSLAVLTSFYMSHLALRRAIAQCDDGTIYDQQPGGAFAVWTKWLNALGGLAFVAGVCFMAIFVSANLSSRGNGNVRQEAHKSAAATAVPADESSRSPVVPGTR